MNPNASRSLSAGSLCAFALAGLLAAGAAGAAWSEPASGPVPTVAVQAGFVSDRLSVEVMGEGPDVVLIPGYASSRDVWRPMAERLAARHRVHLVQLAGFAGEPWTHGDGPFVQPMIDELARYVRTLDRPALIGHSMGGMSALMLAQRDPDIVGRVMSVDSLPFFGALMGPTASPETLSQAGRQAAASILAADEDGFRAAQSRTARGMARDQAAQARIVDWSMASDRRALAVAIAEVMTTDLRPGLAEMTTPVWAVYAADAEGGAPPAMADALWSQEYAPLPGVRLIRVDDSRHFIMADQPERLDEIVDRFLAD